MADLNILDLLETDCLRNFDVIKNKIDQNPSEYWSQLARKLTWKKDWQKLCRVDKGASKWFVGGEINYYEHLFENVEDTTKELLVVYDKNGNKTGYTAKSLAHEVRKAGAFLIDHGVKPGDNIIACIEHRHTAAIYALACLSIGVRCGFSYFRTPNELLLEQISLIEAKTLIYEHQPREVDMPDFTSVSCLKTILVVDIKDSAFEQISVAPAWKAGEEYDDSSFMSHAYAATDSTIILFTSGSTGKPKAIPTGTAGSFVAAINSYYQVFNSSGTNFFCVDFAWVVTLVNFFAPLMLHKKVVMDDRHFVLGSENTYDVFSKENVTSSFIPIAYFEKELPVQKKYLLEKLVIGGTKMNNRALKSMTDFCEPDKLSIVFAYGSSEVGGLALISFSLKDHANWHFEKMRTSLGVEVSLATDTDELLIKNSCPGMCPKLIGDADGSYEKLWSQDGTWFLTGDTAKQTGVPDTYEITGRMNDLIKVKGRWLHGGLYASHLKKVLGRDVTLIDMDNIVKKQHLVLLVEGKERADDQILIEKEVRDKFGGYALPKEIIFLETFPRNHNGKVLRDDLLRYYESIYKT